MGWVRKLAAAALVAALLALALPTPGLADSDAGKEFYRYYSGTSAPLGSVDPVAPSYRTTDAEDGAVLMLSGVIGPGAHRHFSAALARGHPSLIVLDSPGGVLGEAFMIADEVRRRGLSTMVGPNRSCASACAIIFLAGRTKYLGPGGAIGLHMASYADGRADPEATALMADYLSELGVPRSALRAMASTAPSRIRWLTRAELQAVGARAYAAR
jgi:hypothetical protein